MTTELPSCPPSDGAPTSFSAIPQHRMVVLFMVTLVAAAGNTAMQSILPAIGAQLRIPDVWVSLAFSWSALLWVMTAPRWAAHSDRRGRRALMKLGLIGFTVSMAACGLVLWAGLQGWMGAAATFVAFALFRSLYGGFGSAAPPAVQAYVAARTPPAARTRALSLLSSSFGLGTVIGPAVAPFLILPVVGLAGPLFAFALIGLGVLWAVRATLPDDTPAYAARGDTATYPMAAPAMPTDASSDAPSEGAPRLKWHDRRVRAWFIAGLAGGQAQAMILGLIGFVVMDRLALRATPDAAADAIGVVLMAGAVASLLAQWGLIPLLSPGPRTAVLWGCAIATAGIAMLAVADSIHALSVGLAVASLGFGLLGPGFTAGASLAVGRHEQNGVAGVTASINGAAYIASPAIGVGLYNLHAPTAFALIMLLAGGVVAWGWRALRTVVPDQRHRAGPV